MTKYKEWAKNKKFIGWGIFTILTILAFFIYWEYEKRFPSTDNAYVQAHIVQIAPQVSGPILNLFVKEFQTVKKNDSLFDIDPAPFKIAVDKANAEYMIAKEKLESSESAVKVAEASVVQRESEFKLAQKNYDRTIQLVKKGTLSYSEGDKVTSTLEVGKAAWVESQSSLNKAKAEAEVSQAEVDSAKSKLNEANLNLAYTHVTAPTNGYVSNLTARVGTYVKAGVALFAVIDSYQWWADANFKETQIERIRTGQPATIVVDIYPDHEFHGVVQEINRGSGVTFSLFPPENATGNWVKVTQRFTVRILISDPDPNFPLRVGASATATIDTRG